MAMNSIQLNLMGAFQCLNSKGQTQEIGLTKDQGLISILALSGKYVCSRSKLIELLWSTRNSKQSSSSLRQSLWILKKVLTDGIEDVLLIDRKQIGLNPDLVKIDVSEFHLLIDAADSVSLEKAIGLYRGELLDGLVIRDQAWEEWHTIARESLRAELTEVICTLLERYIAEADFPKMIYFGQRLVAHDPFREEGHRAIMRGYTESDQVALALKQFESCRKLLQNELNINPAQETLNLFELIKQESKAYFGCGIRLHEQADKTVATAVKPELPDKPSIAVLPFTNMSGDPEQDIIGDGISEDIITALSKIRSFLVIARNSSFTYRGLAVQISQVASDLGVRYVLEGSVRKSNKRVRVTAQLIDANSGHHVWGEHYDRELRDIFDLQDEMTQTIAGAIEPELNAAERERAINKQPDNLNAWEIYQRGLWYMYRFSKDNVAIAKDLFRQAIESDPNFAPAHAYLSYSYYQTLIMGWSEDTKLALEKGMDAAKKALAIDPKDSVAYFARGRIYQQLGETDNAIASLEKAIELNPNAFNAYHGLAFALILAGRIDEALKISEKAERLSPRDPLLWAALVVRSVGYILSKNFEQTLVCADKVMQIPTNAGYWPHALKAAAFAHLDQLEDANKALATAINEKPDLSIKYLKETLLTKAEGGLEPYISGLRKAGLK